MDALIAWTGASWESVGLILLSTLGIYSAVILYTRVFGLRSFSKMSSFDFAATVAVGSTMAATITSKTPSLAQGATALVCLYAGQRLVAWGRQRSAFFEGMVDNDPVLLMDGSRIIDEALSATGVTRSDLRAKLREANVLQWDEVRAVVLETTGDISVLHGDKVVEDDLLKGVKRY